MKERDIEELYQSILKLLEQKRLKEAMVQIEALAGECRNWSLKKRLEQAQTAYQYMLQYMRQGTEDPQRQSIYTLLLAETWETAEQIRLSILDGSSTHYYHSLCKDRNHQAQERDIASYRKVLEAFPDDLAVCRLMPNSPNVEAVLQRHEQAAREFFLDTWCNRVWSLEDARQAVELIGAELLSVNDVCLFTSAVTLSLMECFDVHKLSWLMEATMHTNTQVTHRAWVGIALAMIVHPHRLPLYPDLVERIADLDREGDFGQQLNLVYIELLRSQETEKVDKQMREEIIPEMMKSVGAMRNTKFGFEENSEENDFNPDWAEAINNPSLENNIRKMNELQLEGADVYMSSFAQLKSEPFFKELPNWFYPFDLHHSSLVKEFGFDSAKGNAMCSLVFHTGFFCNSDKYSFFFLMTRMPQAQRSAMLGQMTAGELKGMLDKEQFSVMQEYAEQPRVVSSQYIHDLYRFFKLHPRKQEFRDIFKEEIALHRIPALRKVLCKPELLKEVADFHFHKEHPIEALELYQELIDMNRADADVFQKAGYCLQKEKRYKEAIDAYRRVDVLKPDHLWTIRHLATCYRLNREFGLALECYKKVEAVQPENYGILFYVGSCLAELERYEEALQCFFKLDFMESDCVKAWRAIGWCSFVSGKHGQAMKYYDKVLDFKPMAVDYLNAGHVAWRMGKTGKAVELYGKAVLEYGNRETFREMFARDRETLIRLGIDGEDMPMMLDLV